MSLYPHDWNTRPELDPEPEPYTLANVLDTRITPKEWLKIAAYLVALTAFACWTLGAAIELGVM